MLFPATHHSNTPLPHFNMEAAEKKVNPIVLAQEIIKFRKEKHPFGYNYAVKVRMGHAWIQDLTAVVDILAAIEELGYELVKKKSP
ncbi:MAG TPA: hypothetical protein VGW77_16435 [Candidatus Binatia bacterium]|nr:hypothetical protein [Candidatus Binatia bacterium]